MLNMDVLTECIISDHRAVAVSIQCSHLPEFDDEVVDPQPSRIDWLKVTAQEREDYYHESKNLLDHLQVPTEVRHCENFNCTDEKHLEDIKKILCRADQCSACCCILCNLNQQVKRMKVNLTFLAGTRWSNQNTKLQRQHSGYG